RVASAPGARRLHTCQGEGNAMGRRNGAANGSRRIEPDGGIGTKVERRRGKIQGRIGKLERQVRTLEDCVGSRGTRVSPGARTRLQTEIAWLAARLQKAADRRLDRIAENLQGPVQ